MTDRLDPYNVVWDSPSRDHTGSMPIGNGDFGANVWVEPNGDLILLISKTDAWDENASLLKLGRVRIKFTPCSVTPFRQTLILRTGEIEILSGDVTLRIWADANHPVIRFEAEGAEAFSIVASLEMWRTAPRTIKTQTSDLFKNLTGKNADPFPTVVSPDQLFPARKDCIVWCHHNAPREHDGYEINMKLQGLGDMMSTMLHPLQGRTFGAAILGEGLRAIDDSTLRSEAPAKRHEICLVALTMHPTTIDAWRNRIDEIISDVQSIDSITARREHERWWDQFWNRSWVFVTSDLESEQNSTFHITQAYVLARFMNAAAGRGPFPIKHNGSIFSVGAANDPDYRRWGGPGFWFMNQRLIYWPMLAAGDFDLMLPWLSMYRDMLPLQKARTEIYFGHGGAHYPETLMFWGAEVSAHYGWTPFEQRARPEAECAYLTYYWSGGIELTLILCEYFNYTQDESFARHFLLPIADAVMEFFDAHYPRDASAKIHFEPAQALETWHEAVNPTPEIAGLRYTLSRLLALPSHLVAPESRARWSRMLEGLPSIPTGEKDGKRVILPAEKFDRKKNTENPELYCIFPYRLFGVGKPDLQLAIDTFNARLHSAAECWSQDDIQMALLGLTDQAKQWLLRRASPAAHSDSRFPGFWNAFHDWIPDVDHAGVLQLALQFMLIQPEDSQILLLPAWPKDWQADFKLHAPDRTIVQGCVRNGEMVDLKITRPQPADPQVIE